MHISLLARTMSRWYENFSQTRCKMTLVIICTVAEMCYLSSHVFVGNIMTHTLYLLTEFHGKKSHGTISDNLGGQLFNIKSSRSLQLIQLWDYVMHVTNGCYSEHLQRATSMCIVYIHELLFIFCVVYAWKWSIL